MKYLKKEAIFTQEVTIAIHLNSLNKKVIRSKIKFSDSNFKATGETVTKLGIKFV